MSIRDGVEPSRSSDSDTHTQPLPRDPSGEAAPDQPAAPAPANPADETWPPSWGESPSSRAQAPALSSLGRQAGRSAFRCIRACGP